jgi:hypothetical protein
MRRFGRKEEKTKGRKNERKEYLKKLRFKEGSTRPDPMGRRITFAWTGSHHQTVQV